MPRTDVTVLVQLRLYPDCVEEGMSELLGFARNVERYEVDCSSIEVAQDIDDPTAVTLIEKWASRAAYEGPHLKTAHMKSFIERASGYFAGSASISFCHGTTVFRDDLLRTAPYGR